MCVCVCVCVCVCLCVCTRAAAREHSSNCVPTCGDIGACESRLREHLLDQLFTVGLGPGCPWKKLAKFSETVFFAPFRLMPRVIYCLQRQSLSRSWTETRWTISYDVTVPHPPPHQSVLQARDSNVLAIITRASLSVLWSEKKICEKITYSNKKWHAKYTNIGKNDL